MGRIRIEVARRGLLQERVDSSGETAEELLDEARWRALWEAEQLSRVQAVRGGAERRLARKALKDEERRARQAALADHPRPVRCWSQQRLGVHPAIPGRAVAGAEFVLPTFVPRPHDAQLRKIVSAACTEGASPRFVVICGASCTGKSRSACEALAAVPDDFDLIFPADSEGLLAALAADALSPRTVLWLNEAHGYFDSPVGNAVAASLLRRLDGEGPLLVIATLWPEQIDALTTRRRSPEQDNPHHKARELFRQALRVDLSRSFADDLDAVRHAAAQDTSLAAALETDGENLTQVLAAGPDLVRHYEQPAGEHGIYGSALMAVAMDAHRLGLSLITQSFLEAAAPGYLTDQQRSQASPNWFTGALAYARIFIKDTTQPFQDVPRPSGMGALSGVLRLADYLQYHGRQTRWARCPPPSFWEAAPAHLSNGGDLSRLADAARARGRFRYASLLYDAAARAGSLEARVALARTREYAGDRTAALRLLLPAAEQGHVGAMVMLALLHNRAGNRTTALAMAQAAAKTGAPYAALAHGLLRLGGRPPSADIPLSPPSYPEARHESEFSNLIHSLSGDDALTAGWLSRLGDAEHLAYESAIAGAPYALARIALLRKWKGDEQGAAQMYQLAIDAGHLGALGGLARIRNESPDAYMRRGLETDGSLANLWTWQDPDSPPASRSTARRGQASAT
ncbi:sel1 repeat family protein [Streptomyces sp. NPDC060053]|uniref:sel1 repeat family protein n=1 Tax=Streptomyces sp. NPDC060053 TaxID=3347047 RepID=UPI00368511FC